MMEGTLTRKGKYWYVVVDIGKDAHGKRIRKWHNTNCESKTEAKKIKRKILSSLDDGTYVEPKKISFSEFILEWLEDDIKVNREATTYESYKQTIVKHIVPFFASIQLQKLQPIHIQKFYKHLLDKGLSANTVKHHHANIHKSLRYALRMGLISRNVSEAIELPKVDKFYGNFYNEQQIDELLKVVKDTYIEVPVTITITMGLRRGEVLGLKWENVNLNTGEMYIINNRVRKGNDIIDKTTKTESSRRILIMPDELIKYLKKVHMRQRINKWTFGNEYNKDDYVCCIFTLIRK
jgi:integrase